MVLFPPCKINLGLNVVARREDGFHNIDTCFFPVPWTDVLEVIPAANFSFTVTGLHVDGSPDDNLCVKAYRLLATEFSLPPVSIHLHKIIPMGAGLGGGSSDAAHVLVALNHVFALKLSNHGLAERASRLGSDCAFFIHNQPMIGSGRGEILKPVTIDLHGKWLMIVKPQVHVSTAEAYAGVIPRKNDKAIEQIVITAPVNSWRENLHNDFEKSVFAKHPPIKQIKEALYNQGAVYASMSGSGSAVYGIFDKPTDLQNQFSESTYWAGRL